MKHVEQDSKNREIRRSENIKSSLVWKEKGNEAFKLKQYSEAVDLYTKAIVLAPDQVVYYSNRAQVSVAISQSKLWDVFNLLCILASNCLISEVYPEVSQSFVQESASGEKIHLEW